MQPAGRDPELLVAPGTVTVPLRSRPNASSFLDNLPAGFGLNGSWNNPHRAQTSNLRVGGSNPSERARKINGLVAKPRSDAE
jgi:hypothetical protein